MNSGNSPFRLLIELILLAVAIGGVLYGLSRKSSVLVDDERILELYRRIEDLEAQNERLLDRIAELK